MLLKYLALALAAAASLGSAANALVIGSNNNGNCQPFACNDSGTATGQSFHYQQIYSASAFDGAGVIDALTFFSWAAIPATKVLDGTYTVTLSTTTAALGSSYAITALSNTASFFTGNLGGAFDGSFTIDGANYAYDPAAGNLLLDIVVTNQDNIRNNMQGYFQADYTGTQTSRAVDTGNGVFSGGGALVTGFSFAVVPEPQAWALMIVGFGLVGAAARRRSAVVA